MFRGLYGITVDKRFSFFVTDVKRKSKAHYVLERMTQILTSITMLFRGQPILGNKIKHCKISILQNCGKFVGLYAHKHRRNILKISFSTLCFSSLYHFNVCRYNEFKVYNLLYFALLKVFFEIYRVISQTFLKKKDIDISGFELLFNFFSTM